MAEAGNGILPPEAKIDLPGGEAIEFRRVLDEGETDAFWMGQRGENPDEEPVHRVGVRGALYVGVYPVTQAQFAAWTGTAAYGEWFAENREKIRESSPEDEAEPHRNQFADRPRHPADSVTWWEARGFAEWLTGSGRLPLGLKADLPSEAQWEYACRAGSETEYWSGNGEKALAAVGWYGANAGGETHPVGEKNRPNPYGLHDLHGNLAEWCLDYYDPRRYRKRVEGEAVLPLMDEDRVEREGEDSAFVAFAEMLGRFASDDEAQRRVEEGDRDRLTQLKTIFDEQIASGAAGLDAVLSAVESALKQGAWPAGAAGYALSLHQQFQGMADAASGTGSPARVLRGGAWDDAAWSCRSAYRSWDLAGDRNWD